MKDLETTLAARGISLPDNIAALLEGCRSYCVFNSTDELAEAATQGRSRFEVTYDVPGKGEVVEAVVQRVANGISANYTEPYMRRRDPGTMAIADDKPTDKDRFADKYGYPFAELQAETFAWLKGQDLAVFFYIAGRRDIGSLGIALAPANAAFFAMGLSMLQKIVAVKDLKQHADMRSVIFVAPTFRHTHFDGRQVVVHNRTDEVHELYSYNLYPGPSAKKGLYGVLLNQGEKEHWVTAHCSAVQCISPYDNVTNFMHEGASGGGKSEMHQHILREPDGRVLLGRNEVTGQERHLTIPRFSTFRSVADDMAFCHPSLQRGDGKLGIIDAENAWFVRVDGVKEYGDDPALEKATIHPTSKLLFLNIETQPDSTALIWNHIEDEPGIRCPNPRVVLPRRNIQNIVDEAIGVDIRSFGLRTPLCTRENPSYGIVGLFHVLPPALAWLWRLVAPRGHNNPSIVSKGGMASEGVGSYWPFATGRRVPQANMLLEQITETPRTTFTLVPNQHIGAWWVGFKPQLLMREYLTLRGAARLNPNQYQAARCPLLGYELTTMTIEGSKIPSRFLQVYNQMEVGEEGYDAGAAMLQAFFVAELPKYLESDLHPTGRRIIEACLDGAAVEDYNSIVPMSFEYEYAFSKLEDMDRA
jgi:hypothetical protein